jgi:hypothetical protein
VVGAVDACKWSIILLDGVVGTCDARNVVGEVDGATREGVA